MDDVAVRVCQREDSAILAASSVFDHPVDPEMLEEFFSRSGHHLIGAFSGETLIGFVSGVEVAHPDKAVEMMLYELGVDELHRRRGIGRSLVIALLDLAAGSGIETMWVPLGANDEVARATYASSGASHYERAAVMTWDLEPRMRSTGHGRSDIADLDD